MRSLIWVASFSVMTVVACAAERPYVWAHDVPREAAGSSVIVAGDKIFLLVEGQPTLTGEYVIGADGTIVQPVIGRVTLAGLTPDAASSLIATRLKGLLQDPRVTVSVPVPRRPEVTVLGEVSRPGHFAVKPGAGVLDAIARAGGLTEFADTDGIFVLRQAPTKTRVRFRYEDLTGGDAESVAFELRDGDVVVVE